MLTSKYKNIRTSAHERQNQYTGWRGYYINRKRVLRRIIAAIATALFVSYIFYQSSYSFSENKVLRSSYPDKAGVAVFEEQYEDKKVVVWQVNRSSLNDSYVKLVEKKWGLFHHVADVGQLTPMSPWFGAHGDIYRTWSASLNKDQVYDTIIAVQSNHPDIKKIIVSNDDIDLEKVQDVESSSNLQTFGDLQFIKDNSTVFLELELENGSAAVQKELSSTDAGAFIFRGFNEAGELVVIGY